MCVEFVKRFPFRQRFEKGDEIGLFTRAQVEAAQNPFTSGVQPFLVDCRIVADDVGERLEAAGMHVGRGERHVAQARHPELAEVALAQANVAGLGGGGASGIVVEAAQQGIRARAQLADAAVPAGIDPAGLDEMRHAGIGELAVGKGRAEMAEEAVAPADEQAQAAHGGGGIAGLAGRIVARQGVAEIVERRAAGDSGFQERRQCLA